MKYVMKDCSYMINRLEYFKAKEVYQQLVSKFNLLKIPDFNIFLEVIPQIDATPVPFKPTNEFLSIELTSDGYRRYQMLTNPQSHPHTVTLLAMWIVQHTVKE